MSDDAELQAFAGRLHKRQKMLAVLGLILVGGALIWRFSTLFT